MTLHYASDLHLEFPENRQWLRQHPLQGAGGVLLLAGDVMPFHTLPKHKDMLKLWADQYDQVLWLPGNHEYYGSDILQRSGTLDEALAGNVRLVNDTTVYMPGLRILCTTLWTRIGQLNETWVRQSVNDYHQIRHGNALLLPAHTTRLHQTSLQWLTTELAKPFAGATVVATHHVPTLLHYPAQYKGDPLNEAFAVELHELIANCGAAAWIYGHHHRNTPPFTIGATRMLTNQLGYVRLGEDSGFEGDRRIGLDPMPTALDTTGQ
jgi:predicted phosphohydrolase